jgi:hypothetical protein
MDIEKIEHIFNKTFAGLALFYRDTDLSEAQLSGYKTDSIIRERGFTDMSYKGAGLATNSRYLIASAFGRDVSLLFPQLKEFGAVMLPSKAFFKVLDVFKIGEKTQIVLLNIDEADVPFFASAKSNLEEDIVAQARENFKLKLDEAPLSELRQTDWLERTEFPLGMDQNGVLFGLKDEKPEAKAAAKPKPWWKFW